MNETLATSLVGIFGITGSLLLLARPGDVPRP